MRITKKKYINFNPNILKMDTKVRLYESPMANINSDIVLTNSSKSRTSWTKNIECETELGDRFKVVQQGTMEERQMAYYNARKDGEGIGDMLKVKFFELTDDGIPRFPVGLGIRPLEDM